MDSTDSVSKAVSPTGEWTVDEDCDGFVSVSDQAVNTVSRLVLSSQANGPSPLDEDPEGRLVEIIQRIAPNGTVSIELLQDVGDSILANPEGITALFTLAGTAPLRALPTQHQELPPNVQEHGAVISKEEMIEHAVPVIHKHFPQASTEEARIAAEGIVSKFIDPVKKGGAGTKTKKTRDITLLVLAIGTIAITVILKYKKGDFNNMTPLMKSALNKVINFIRG